jgi:hypothetical protein
MATLVSKTTKVATEDGLEMMSQQGWIEHEYEYIQGRHYAILWRDPSKYAWDTKPTDPCPFCRTPHNHSAGDGHRLIHCASSKGKPKITASDGTVLYANDGYIIRTRLQAQTKPRKQKR